MKKSTVFSTKLHYLLIFASGFSVIATALSTMIQERIHSEGFISFYDGPALIIKGFPWMFFRCYDKLFAPLGPSGCFIQPQLLVITWIFWLAIGLVIGALTLLLSSLIKKRKK